MSCLGGLKAVLPLALMVIPGAIWGAPTPAVALLATSKGDHTLAIVDPKSGELLVRMPVGPDPHEIAVSTDGRTAYVSNMGRALHRIDVLDLVGQRALPPIDTGALTGLHGLAFAGGRLWFTAQGAKAVGHLDPNTVQVDWVVGTGQEWTHMLVLAPGERAVYASNVRSGTVSILELRPSAVSPPPGGVGPGPEPERPLEWVHSVVTAEPGIEGIDLSPDGKEVWTASATSGRVYVLETASHRVAQIPDANIKGANRLAFTHDGERVLVTSLRTGELLVLDARARREVKRLVVGTGCAGVLVAPDDSRAYVACSADDYIAVVDLKTYQVVGHLNVGPVPDGLAWSVR